MSKSLAEQLASLPEADREAILAELPKEQLDNLAYDANFWLRPEQIIPDGDWYITALIAGRGFGKGIHLSTPVPTPDGWRKMEELQTGDRVFDENGMPCNVIVAHDPYTPTKKYRLTFADGSVIEADGDHLWNTWTHRDRKSYNRRNDYLGVDNTIGNPDRWFEWTKDNINGTTKLNPIGPSVKSTDEIVSTFRHGSRGDLNHSIPVTRPIQYPEKDLPIDPYVFGSWLGDGSKSSGVISCHVNESAWLSSFIAERGYSVKIGKSAERCDVVRVDGLSKLLKDQNSFETKHIPEAYLLGSEQQRRDLLAGLLDTDGSIDPRTDYIEFCAKRRDHADAVMELARSLGQKPRMYIGRATLNGKDYGEKYRVQWRPTENFFYMPRKAEVFKPLGKQASRTMHRMITSFEEIDPTPVRCLTVDSESRLFLVGEAMIPTHNTLAMSQWIRKKAMENPGCRIAIAARTTADLRNTVVTGESGILAVHPEAERPEYKPSTTSLHWPNGSSALLLSSEAPDSARGPQFHFAVGDEFAAWKTDVDSSGATLYSNIIAATRLGENPQILLATTPKRTKVMQDLMKLSKDPEEKIHIIRGSTFDNTSLSTKYIDNLVRRYGNSDLAKQELYGQMLDDAEGLVFTQAMIENAHLKDDEVVPHLPLRFIAVDPSVSGDPSAADECGIMAVGCTIERDLTRRRAYVLGDYSLRAAPDVWAKQVVDAAQIHRTRFVVVEKNQGGQLLQMAINAVDPTLKVFLVVATKGKVVRAEPVVIAMQQERVKFIDYMPVLEEQLLFFDPDNSTYSPDRMDAFVWGIVAALVTPPPGMRTGNYKATSASSRKLPQGLATGRTQPRSPSMRRR
jgi:phage terminase large subunit-like protein